VSPDSGVVCGSLLQSITENVSDVTPAPPVPISRGSTVIFDIVEYIIIIQWNGQLRMKVEYPGYVAGAYPKKKKKCVASQFPGDKYRSETY
jgi:hypothetical protein